MVTERLATFHLAPRFEAPNGASRAFLTRGNRGNTTRLPFGRLAYRCLAGYNAFWTVLEFHQGV